MMKLRNIFRFLPKATRGHPTNKFDDWSDDIDRRGERFKYFMKVTRIYFLGTRLEKIQKPFITSKDCFFILITIHLNIRFLCQYIDLSLEWGGFMVWLIFTLVNIIMCPPIAIIYTFLGNYGKRSFLIVWHIMPFFFLGIKFSVIFIEILKIMETSLILSSGFMSFNDFFRYSASPPVAPIICNNTLFILNPGVAVPHGASKAFMEYGYKFGKADITNWNFNRHRANCVAFVWICVNLVRFFQFQRYKIFLLRGTSIALTSFILICILANSISNITPISKIVLFDSNKLVHLEAFLQIFTFSLREYLPSFWVTLGYLHEKPLVSKIWMIAGVKIVFSFFLLYWIPFVAEDFKISNNVESDACLNFFGIHFFFVMIPNTIRSHLWLSTPLYTLYFTWLMSQGFAHIVLCIDLYAFSIPLEKQMMFRYRNLAFMIFSLFICCLSLIFAVDGIHYILFFINTKAHFFSNMFILAASTCGIACYGLYRINGDHLFMTGEIFSHSTPVKIMFVGMFVGPYITSGMFILETFNYQYRLEDNSGLYWALTGVCIFPFSYGIWKTMSNKMKYHGYCQPLNIWGMETSHLRNQRRKKTMHTMYAYRMKYSCNHNCLLNHPKLSKEIESNLNAQEVMLEILRKDLFQSMYERKSRTSELIGANRYSFSESAENDSSNNQ